jgi:hypothetical protein
MNNPAQPDRYVSITEHQKHQNAGCREGLTHTARSFRNDRRVAD